MLRRISPIHSGSGIPEEQQELLDQLAAIDRADGLGLDIVKRIQARG